MGGTMNPKSKLWIPALLLLAAAVPMVASCGQSASADELVVTYYYLPG